MNRQILQANQEFTASPSHKTPETESRDGPSNEQLVSEVQDRFNNYYTAHQYKEAIAEPLISKRDKSVIYTGAGISALKQQLIKQDYPPDGNGYFLTQECLRAHRIGKLFDDKYIPYGQTYFLMTTVLSKPGRFQTVTQEAIRFLTDELSIDPHRIMIRATRQIEEASNLQETIQEACSVEYDVQDPEYYMWTYGMKGISGIGITISMQKPNSDEYIDIGNIVKITNQEGEELGTEFGFGYEFLLSGMSGIEPPLRFSRVFDWVEFEEGLSQKYYCYLEACVRMKASGAGVGNYRENHIYLQYLKSLVHMGARLDKGIKEIISDLQGFSEFAYQSGFDFSIETQRLKRHKKNIEDFSNLVRKITNYLWNKHYSNNPQKRQNPGQVVHNPEERIRHYLKQKGIRPDEVAEILAKLDRFIEDGYIERIF